MTMSMPVPMRRTLVGVDEVGRGCLAGPVWACAYAFRDGSESSVEGLRDSKKLSARQRGILVPKLQKVGWFGHGFIEAEGIDQMGIVLATFAAMHQALVNLQATSGLAWKELCVVIDGNVLPAWPGLTKLPLGELSCMVKADDLVPAVSAASVLAKEARDALMSQMEAVHPGYGFSAHAGYGTPVHMQAIKTIGPSQQHRMSFAPMSRMKEMKSATPKRSPRM